MNLSLVVTAAELANALDNQNLIILDLSSRENYLAGHIPGAVHLQPAQLLRGHGPIPNLIPEPQQLSELFSHIGLTPEKHVVVYDDQMGPLAGRMIWTLNCVGHQQCSFLDGQLKSWIAAGLQIETIENQPRPAVFNAAIDPALLADIDYITAHRQAADHRILDVRSAAEFSGEKVINARKGGHIPGAVNYEWTRALISGDNLQLRPADEIMTELKALGLSPEQTIITHCQTHRRSGLSYLFLKHLGFDKVRCYDGSWFEWGNHPDTPVDS